MRIDDALEFFENVPRIRRVVQTLHDVGLGYISLGQSSTTLSGGESQRVKLATELTRRDTGKTIYLMDEPTTGLHFRDISVLMEVLNKLVNRGNTVVIIEHNLDVVKMADWVIDVGPEGGAKGGFILFEGTPEQLAKQTHSATAPFLAAELSLHKKTKKKKQ
jgi:excinuclease ABC subunit A